ncbi:NUDIX hydrolase [Viridibacillus sp. NPDC093762]|uniref:NUDIX hydrolase n=1 Tax=Viridibacillus sp. NPDC093762 TaxID=3390720 RepID=UPI003CFE1388
MRNRAATVIIREDKVALLKRNKGHGNYYVFAGGGIEHGETAEQAAIRETFEELGVHVELKKLLTTVPYNGTQYYFTAQIISGEFGTGNGEEFTKSSIEGGTYEAVWLPLTKIGELDVRPLEVVKILLANDSTD